MAARKYWERNQSRKASFSRAPYTEVRVAYGKSTRLILRPLVTLGNLMELDTAFLDRIIGEHGGSSQACIPLLQELQAEWRYLPWEALKYICEHTDITPTQISGVATFYAQFRLTPVGKHVVKVCHGTACHVGGAEGLSEALEEHLCCKSGETTADDLFTLEKVACVGCCSLAPCLMIGNTTFGRLDRKKVVTVIEEFKATGQTEPALASDTERAAAPVNSLPPNST